MKFLSLIRLLSIFAIILGGCSEKPASVIEKTLTKKPTTSIVTKKTPQERNRKNKLPKIKSQIPKVVKPPIDERLYDGQQLSVWKAKFKNLDCTIETAKRSVDGLIEIVHDDDLAWFTRKQAGRLLGKIGKPAEKAIPVFDELLRKTEQDDSTLRWSLRSLAEFAAVAKSSTPEIAKIALDRNRILAVRLEAMSALARIGTANPQAISTLEKLLDARMRRDANTVDDMWQLRKSAAEAIRVIGSDASSSVPALTSAVRRSGNNSEVRYHAIRALGAIGSKAEPAIKIVADAMVFDNVGFVCDAASETLGAIGPSAIPALLEKLENPTAETRARIARSLGLMGASARETLENLDRLLDDDDGNVRLSAAIAIWEIDRNGRRCVPAIVLELTNADRRVRRKAYEELKELEFSPKIVERALSRLKGDERGYVRSIARKALRMIRSQK